MEAAEQEVFRELRQERLWRLAERVWLWTLAATVGVLLVGLVSAATVVLMDGFDAPVAVGDDQ